MEEEYRRILEAQMAQLVHKPEPQAPPPASPPSSQRAAPASPRTPSSPSARTRCAVPRASSAEGKRPCATAMESSSRASLRQTRNPRQSSGSLLRAASLTSRPSTLWDPRQSCSAARAESSVGEAQAAGRKAGPARERAAPPAQARKEAGSAERELEQPCPSAPSAPSVAHRRQRAGGPSPGAAAGGAPPSTPRGKAAARISNAPRSAFGRAAVGHLPRRQQGDSVVAAPAATALSPRDECANEEKDLEAFSRERERARAAWITAAASRQQATEDARLREDEQRRRAAALRERARLDREAARLTRESAALRPVTLSPDALEGAWLA